MYRNLKVTAIISAFNEEKLVGKTIDTLPPSVDAIIVTNDGSTDGTLAVLERMAAADPRITIVNNQPNLGLGASLRNAYRRFLSTDSELVCVLPGDAQHDPEASRACSTCCSTNTSTTSSPTDSSIWMR